MNNNVEKLLPIGTIVLLKNGKKRVMITGFMVSIEKDGIREELDYTGCIYPEDFMGIENTVGFNHDEIEKIYHLGLKDREEEEYKSKLKKIIEYRNMFSSETSEDILNQPGISVPNQQLDASQIFKQPTENQITQPQVTINQPTIPASNIQSDNISSNVTM